MVIYGSSIAMYIMSSGKNKWREILHFNLGCAQRIQARNTLSLLNDGEAREELAATVSFSRPFEYVLVGAGDRIAGALGRNREQMAVRWLLNGITTHNLFADAFEDRILRRKPACAF